jgi:hypothetical protein
MIWYNTFKPFGSFLIIVLLFVTSCKSKKELEQTSAGLSAQTEKLVAEIEADNYIGTRYMARIQTESPAWARRQQLMNDASDNELILLATHANAVVMLTAFEGLHRRKHSEAKNIFTRLTYNNEKVSYIKGDIYSSMPVLEYAFVYVLGYTIPGEEQPYMDITPEKYLDLTPVEVREVMKNIEAYRRLR